MGRRVRHQAPLFTDQDVKCNLEGSCPPVLQVMLQLIFTRTIFVCRTLRRWLLKWVWVKGSQSASQEGKGLSRLSSLLSHTNPTKRGWKIRHSDRKTLQEFWDLRIYEPSGFCPHFLSCNATYTYVTRQKVVGENVPSFSALGARALQFKMNDFAVFQQHDSIMSLKSLKPEAPFFLNSETLGVLSLFFSESFCSEQREIRQAWSSN